MSEAGGVGSQWNGEAPTGKSVSVSCRACVRAGEAKLRVNLLYLDRNKSESPLPQPARARTWGDWNRGCPAGGRI